MLIIFKKKQKLILLELKLNLTKNKLFKKIKTNLKSPSNPKQNLMKVRIKNKSKSENAISLKYLLIVLEYYLLRLFHDLNYDVLN